jgi:uncharacterized protein (DUF2267 family)
MGHPIDVERASEMHVEWCKDLADRMGVVTTHQSGPQMRAVMHELRSSIPPGAVLRIANALPALERGIFIEGWSLTDDRHNVRDAKEFSDRVYDRVKGHHARVPSLVEDVFWLWNNKLGAERAAIIRDCLPSSLRPLWRIE